MDAQEEVAKNINFRMGSKRNKINNASVAMHILDALETAPAITFNHLSFECASFDIDILIFSSSFFIASHVRVPV